MEFYSEEENSHSDSEVETRTVSKSKGIKGTFEVSDDENEDEMSDNERKIDTKKRKFDAFAESDEEEEEEEQEEQDEILQILHQPSKLMKPNKLKKLTPEQLDKQQKKLKRTGVLYLSKIPPYMKPSKLKSVLSRFGEVDRVFLKPEDQHIYSRRVKYGGTKRRNFTEGWCEFVNKKDAKLAVATLNGNKIGGKKRDFYYDDIINCKYLSGFKWADLTQQISKEHEIRSAKMSMELSQATKLNKTFINNMEKSKMIKNIQNKKKKQAQAADQTPNNDDNDIEMRRNFRQRKINSMRADSDETLKVAADTKLKNVLSRVF